MITIAVTGLSGLIGSDLPRRLQPTYRVVDLFHAEKSMPTNDGMTHVHLDLLDPESVARTLDAIHPQIILNLAGVTHIDRCEEERHLGKESLSWKVNVEGTAAIARYAQSSGAFLIHLSTECVFDGKKGTYHEHDSVNPINWYGETKARGEEFVDTKSGAILRSIVAYDTVEQKKTLYGNIITTLKKFGTVKAVHDHFFSPTYLPDMIDAILSIIRRRSKGIHHLCSTGEISPYQFAVHVAKLNNIPEQNIIGVSAQDFFGRDKALLRLEHGSFDCTDTLERLGLAQHSVSEIFSQR